jgi:hypothetical protein
LRRTALQILIPLCVLSLFGVPARATTFIPTDLAELSREARTIARGHVSAVEPRWTDDRRRIETLVTVDADTYLKGPLGPRVQFVVPGGRLGRFRSITVGAPDLTVGDQVVVFLGVRGPGIPFILGLSQGLFHVSRTADGSVVTPPPILAGDSRPARIIRGDPTRRSMALGEFERQVRALAGAAR